MHLQHKQMACHNINCEIHMKLCSNVVHIIVIGDANTCFAQPNLK